MRRFPYSVLVRLVEPRTTTVTEVFVPGKKLVPGLDGKSSRSGQGCSAASEIEQTRFVERVPVDKPISVDGFRDQLIDRARQRDRRRPPRAHGRHAGLGYVLNLSQVAAMRG